MKQIFIIGAGYVANTLIHYLSENSNKFDWQIKVGDLNFELAKSKVANKLNTHAIQFDVMNDAQCKKEIDACDVVISLLPAKMHHIPAKYCLENNSHLITASYVSKEIKAFDQAAKEKGLLFMSEMGLDPGIDHMVIMKMIAEIEEKGAEITGLRSFTGGLIADESDTNPWRYKFTWAPRNVVLAGQGTAQYKKNNKLKFVPYKRLFSLYDAINIDGFGNFEAYANRDSLSYMPKYGLENIPTFIRGTLRKQGFCDSWNALVQLGLTDDSFPIIGSQNHRWNNLIDFFLPDEGAADKKTLVQRLSNFLDVEEDNKIIKKIDWLGILDATPITLKDATPAQILQSLLEDKWKLEESDKDLIVMSHIFDYQLDGKEYKLQSDLAYVGKNANDTGMGRLVGMPLALMAKHLLIGNVTLRGVQIPIDASIYNPVIKDLEAYGVHFNDTLKEV